MIVIILRFDCNQTQATKFGNYLVSGKFTSSVNNVYFMLSAANHLANNKVYSFTYMQHTHLMANKCLLAYDRVLACEWYVCALSLCMCLHVRMSLCYSYCACTRIEQHLSYTRTVTHTHTDMLHSDRCLVHACVCVCISSKIPFTPFLLRLLSRLLCYCPVVNPSIHRILI